jgi:ABC-type nitrate/sulfonate/bicarbonate transport system substrate-binding protein
VMILAVASVALWFGLRPKPIVGTVRLGAVPAAYYLPLMVAVDQHLFEKYGYKGDLDVSNNNNEMINKLLRGEVQVSALGSGGAFPLQVASPGRIRFVYGQNSKSYSLLVPLDSKLQGISDLKGKRIGTWQSPTPMTFLHLMLDDRIGKDGFEVVTDDSKRVNQLLTRGSVDALYNTDVFTQQAVESGIARVLSQNPLEDYVMKPFFNGGGLVLRDMETKQPDLYRTVVTVMREAVQFISAHPGEARRSLVRHIEVSASIARDAPIDDFVQLEAVDRTKAQRVADLLFESGLLKQRINVVDLF